MKPILLSLILCIALYNLSLAQTTQLPNQSPQLEEAAKLTAQVVRLYNEKKYDEALPLAKRTVEIREKELGKENELVASALGNLAMIYKAKKDYFNAEAPFRRVVKIREKILGPQHPGLHDYLINLAWVVYANNKSREAEELFQRAISIREQAFGMENIQTAVALQHLAVYYQKDGKPAKSIPVWQRIIAIREKSQGQNHRDVADAIEQCACAFAQNKQMDQAMPLWTQAEMIYYGTDSTRVPVTGGVLQGKALKRVQPQYPEAAKALKISGTVLVRVEIDESGAVTAARLLCGPDIISQASVEAAWKWSFSPTSVSGTPVRVRGTLTFNFTLQ